MLVAVALLEDIMDKDDQAFPGFSYTDGRGNQRRNEHSGEWETHGCGMSIRAYLAGRAMQGLLAAETEESCYVDSYKRGDGTTTYSATEYLSAQPGQIGKAIPTTLFRTREQQLAADAVAMADALIAELNKPQPAPAAPQP